MSEEQNQSARKPSWLKVKLPKGRVFKDVQHLIKDNGLVTVCEEAMCPNRGECWSHGTATFMACGDVCTRACGFCATLSAILRGSSGSSGLGFAVRVAQNPQARVHTSPQAIKVAVPWLQHSPRFGHIASSHTVTRPLSLMRC